MHLILWKLMLQMFIDLSEEIYNTFHKKEKNL